MNLKLMHLTVLAGIAALFITTGCGGGDSTTPPPAPGPHPGDDPGGDDPDPVTIGEPPGQFTLPGGAQFGDLRGVAVSQKYVYVADNATIYCFDKNGGLVNAAGAPNTIQGLAVLPPAADVDLPGADNYRLANFPVVLTSPTDIGIVFIYPPNLDTDTTREDVDNPDGIKRIDLGLPSPLTVATYDLGVDRFGSLFVCADVDDPCTQALDWPRGLQVYNRFTGYQLEVKNGPLPCDAPNTSTTTPPPYHRIYGDLPGDFQGAIGAAGVGDSGTLALDTFFPFNRPELEFTYYSGHFNFTRDFVGVGSVRYEPFSTPSYVVPTFVSNNFGTYQVIGETIGNAPGSFSQTPPVSPDGGLEDPDLTAGGPSGMSVDPLTDELYICDPGNRRIQVFDPDTFEFIRQIGDGQRGISGNAFLAPSSVAVDYQGNMFVCDVNNLRYIQEKLGDRKYGDVGGTVRRLDTSLPLQAASVTIGNELGTLAAASTNSNGQYAFFNIRIGTYYMTATKFNYDSDTAAIPILPDIMVEANFNLNPRTPPVVGSYVGDIIDADTNLYLRDVTVNILGTSLTATTDFLGHFIFPAVAPGTYQVTYSRDGYETLTRDVTILAGQTTSDTLIQLVPLPVL